SPGATIRASSGRVNVRSPRIRTSAGRGTRPSSAAALTPVVDGGAAGAAAATNGVSASARPSSTGTTDRGRIAMRLSFEPEGDIGCPTLLIPGTRSQGGPATGSLEQGALGVPTHRVPDRPGRLGGAAVVDHVGVATTPVVDAHDPAVGRRELVGARPEQCAERPAQPDEVATGRAGCRGLVGHRGVGAT